MDINDAERMRVCKRCNECVNMLANFNRVKEVEGKMYYSHTCKKCTVTKRQNYMKAYHSTHYVSRKRDTVIPVIPNELAVPDAPVQ